MHRTGWRGTRREAIVGLAALGESDDPRAVIAAGEIALYVRTAALARPSFERALLKDPMTGRARLPGGSGVDGRDWDTVARRMWDGRDQGGPERLRRAIGAAITELQRIAVSDGSGPCRPGQPGCRRWRLNAHSREDR